MRGQQQWRLLQKVVIGLLVITVAEIKYSVELRSSHPMHDLVEKVNQNVCNGRTGYIGVVMAFSAEEIALQNSGFFVHNSQIPWVDLIGRRFNIGKIENVDVIYVMTGEQMVNAAITVQILLDTFDVRGIVHYGTAGSSNDSLSFGDVSVMSHVTFTNSWKWKEYKSEGGESGDLRFGDFNVPKMGENLLGKVEFMPTQLYTNDKPMSMEEVFWFQVDSNWFNIATKLEDLMLQQCINETYCLPETPVVVTGMKGSTADVFLDNAAYREFLFREFNVSTVDEESAAIVMACQTNGVPCIVFRGVSDLAGGEGNKISSALSSLASVNALTVAVEFIKLIGNKKTMYSDEG